MLYCPGSAIIKTPPPIALLNLQLFFSLPVLYLWASYLSSILYIAKWNSPKMIMLMYNKPLPTDFPACLFSTDGD